MKIAIVDDLQKDIEHFTELAGIYSDESRIPISVYGFNCGEKLLCCPYTGEFDAAVIDIYMSGMNGVETAQKLLEISPKCKIIFATTSPDFAVQGFEIGVVHYLVKPLQIEQVRTAINRILDTIPVSDKYIELRSGREVRKVRLSEIYYADYYAHAVFVHTAAADIKSFMKFADIEKELADNPNFINCYRNIVVNMDYISRIEKREIHLQNGVCLPINKQRAKEIRAAYADYIFGKMGKM